MITDDVRAEVLQGAGNKEESKNISCQGNEAELANCLIEPAVLPCQPALVQCNVVTDDKGPSNVPSNVADGNGSLNVTRRQGSSGESPTGAVVGAVIAVLVVGVGVAVLVVVIGVIWWKKKHLKPGNTRFAF